ncbi:hypothetical protein OROHE_022785 [Orobanche hederae]
MGKHRGKNDLLVKKLGPGCKGQKMNIQGISTRKYYDSSSPHYRVPPIRMSKIVSFSELAIRFYNLKEHTNFGQVKVLKVVRSMGVRVDNYITFEAFSRHGVASVFITKIHECFDAYRTFEIKYVRIKHNGRNSQQELPHHIPEQRIIFDDSLYDLAPYLSRYALVIYNIFTLRVKKDAVHDIPSLEVVNAIKQDAEGTTYLVTFQASLREEREIVETLML